MDERRRLQSPDVNERAAAAEALSLMGPDAAFATIDLVVACGDQESVCEWAIAALEQLGPPPRESITELGKLIGHENPTVAYWAITLLGRAGENAARCEPQLTAALIKSEHERVRERAAWAFGKIGAGSENAILALHQAESSSSPRLSRLANNALQNITQ